MQSARSLHCCEQAKIMELQAREAQGCPQAAAQLKQMKAKDEL